MIWFDKSSIKFCRSFMKFDKFPQNNDMQLGQGEVREGGREGGRKGEKKGGRKGGTLGG